MTTKMNWQNLLSVQHFRTKDGEVIPMVTSSTQEEVDALRTDLHIGHDRVVFSGSFRRLGRKMQVHPLTGHDPTHNRLTHSVEVVSVGRSVGNRVGVMLQTGGFLPEGNTPNGIGAVVQVACLAHDLGNPSFGHIGEDALRHWFRNSQNGKYLQDLGQAERNDVQAYGGNAYSLRILASLEMYPNGGGMRLTSATIGALLKYPWTMLYENDSKKSSIYQTELPFIRRVVDELGLIELGADYWARHPLLYLVRTADDICYALPDLEDTVGLDLLGDVEVESILSEPIFIEPTRYAQSGRQRYAMLCGIAIRRAIEGVAQTFMVHQSDLLAGCFKGKDLLALYSPAVQNTLEKAREPACMHIFRHHTELITEAAIFPCLGSILDLPIPAVHALIVEKKTDVRRSLTLEPLRSNKPILEGDSLYQAHVKILDSAGGMADNAAVKMARDLSGLGIHDQPSVLTSKAS